MSGLKRPPLAVRRQLLPCGKECLTQPDQHVVGQHIASALVQAPRHAVPPLVQCLRRNTAREVEGGRCKVEAHTTSAASATVWLP